MRTLRNIIWTVYDNWVLSDDSKLEVLAVNHGGNIMKSDGVPVKRKQCMTYLGGLLAVDGRNGPELGRRLGLAEQTFWVLHRV